MFLMGMELPEKAIKKQIASAVDIFIHLGRDKNKKRVVFSIDEVLKTVKSDIEMNNLFYYDFGKGELVRSNNGLINVGKMERRGIDYNGL